MGGTVCAGITTSGRGVRLEYHTLLEGLPNFQVRYWEPILSEDLTWSYLARFYQFINRSSLEQYHALWILHGTDTLVYTAALLHRTLRVTRPVFILGTQRSPDHPNWELPPLVTMLTSPLFMRVKASIYIVNYRGPTQLQLLHPLTTRKVKSYQKGCYQGQPQYAYRNGHLHVIKIPHRTITPFKGFHTTPLILYITPATQTIPTGYDRIILVAYGLGNLPNRLLPLIAQQPATFYLVNSLAGPKTTTLYGMTKPPNLIVMPYNIQVSTLLLSLC